MNKNSRRYAILFISALLLLGLFGINRAIQFGNANKNNLVFDKLTKPEITGIRIQNNDKETRIYKIDNQWKITRDGIEYTADEERIDTIIDSSRSLRKNDPVSNNKNKRNEFGIGKQKITLETTAGENVIYVGKNAGISSVYISINNDSSIFIAEGFNDTFVNEDYRDLNLKIVGDEKNVSDITVEYEGRLTHLEKKNNEWFNDGIKLSKERVDFLINDIKTLKASGMDMSTVVEEQRLRPVLTLSLIEKDSKKILTTYFKNQETQYVKTNLSDLTYQLPDVYISALKKEEKDFLE